MSKRIAASLMLLTLAIGACSGTGSDPVAPGTTAKTSTESTTTTRSGDGESAIPFGTYVKVDTRASLLDSGVDESLINEIFGSEDQITYTFKIDDGVWAQFAAVGDSAAEPGDGGTYTYEDGRFVTTNPAGAIQAINWNLDGDQLTFHIDWDHSPSGSELQRKTDSLVIDGVYEKTG